MIVNEKIKNNENDVNLKINLNVLTDIYGYDQDIDGYIENITKNLINPIIDGEINIFTISNINLRLNAEFYSFDNGYAPNFSYAGFNHGEIVNYSKNLRNSFYIFEFFDNYKKKIRKKIFTNYYSKIWRLGLSDLYYQPPIINNVNELNQLMIPIGYLNKKPSNFDLYFRLYFYNGKYGNIIMFYNNDIGIHKEEGFFFKISVNKNNNTWYSYNSPINGREFIQNSEFVNSLNDSNETFDVLNPKYPESLVFNIDGTYGDNED